MEKPDDYFDNIINEIKYKNEDKDKRRERALAIGEYLQSNIYGDGFYKLDRIDPEKLSNATKSMKIPEKDVVLAIRALSSNGTENTHKLAYRSSIPAVRGSRSGLSSPRAMISGSVKA